MSDALELSLALTDEEQMLAEMVDRLVADRIAGEAARWDACALIDPAIPSLLEAQGLLDTAALGPTTRLCVLVVERLARGSAGVAALVACHQDLGALTGRGAPARASLVRGGREPIRATRKRSRWLLEGTAPRVEGEAVELIVFAETDDGEAQLLAIEAGAIGVTAGPIQHGPGLRGVPTRSVHLDGCPATHFGGHDAARAVLRHHALTVAAMSVGVAAAALETSTAYATERRQFGSAISTFPAVRSLLEGIRTRIAVASMALWHAVDRPGWEPAIRAAFLASQTARSVSLDAIQVHGGYGCIAEYPVERYLRDAISLRARAGESHLGDAPL